MDIEERCLFRINKLPEELVREIYDYIPGIVKVFLNKNSYKIYHSLIKIKLVEQNLYDSYIRDVIRNDYNFLFLEICLENTAIWVKPKKCTYKNKMFSTYSDLLENLCIESQSTRCRNILQEIFYISALSKNRHKKNIPKIIKREWIN